ncbi:hypothetical protein V9T40_012651 [Parthenolecanium corni]|uniref:Uncharacterized protein n=1 Tax=Parthenolecanium corni TaxID=536013 RepID=A0AAN9T850_9HEMI
MNNLTSSTSWSCNYRITISNFQRNFCTKEERDFCTKEERHFMDSVTRYQPQLYHQVFYKIHKNECKVQKTSGAIFSTSTLTTTERGTTIYTSAVPTDNEPVTQKNFSTTTEKEQAESSGVIFNTSTMTTTERGTTIYTSAVPTDNEPVTQKNFSTTTEKEQAEWGSLEEYLND